MKKIFWILICLLLIHNNSTAQTVYDDNYQENPNYIQGNKYLENSQYSSAINEFKKALRVNPLDSSSLIGLSNSYSMRAAYYNNTVKATDNAISDLKSALFFTKYFSADGANFTTAQTVLGLEKNLNTLESSVNKNITPEYRIKNAKNSRIKGEFGAAAYDYYQLLNNTKYSYEANSSLGDIYKIFNRPDKALVFYQKALAINSDSTEIHLKLARTYEQMNDINSALKEYDYALKTSDEREDILNSLERIWQQKVDEYPKDAEAHANLGVVFQKQKRYAEALTEYKRAEELNPSNLNTKINIATLYQEQKKYDMAINTYNSILKIQPYNAKVLVYKAECLKALKQNEEAVNLYKTALNIEPKNVQIKAALYELLKETMPTEDVLNFLYKNVQNSPMNADSYYEFAYELHNAGKIDDAIVYYLETIKLDNKKIDAYINLSQAYRQKKAYNSAYQLLQKAALIAPEDERVKKQLDIVKKEYLSNKYAAAANAFQSGDYARAINEYRMINPPTSESLMGIAAAYQSMSNNTEAINYYKKAMEIDTKNGDIPFYIASIYVNMNDLENAQKYITASLAINPNNKQVKELSKYLSDKKTEKLLAEAIKLYDTQKYNESIKILDDIISINNTNATAYYYRALCYDAQNNYKTAIENYKITLKYAPEMTIVYYSLGVDYDATGDYKQAKENYKKYIELNIEDNDYSEYAKKRISEIN